jgi:glycosyltransferase involved in cell wall biosynthesis
MGGEAIPDVAGITVVLPAYGEEANLETTVRGAVSALTQLGVSFDIVVVDDGSRDATGRIADALARESPRVTALHHPTNRGYGAALRTGFAAATQPWIFFTDSDGQFDVAQLARLLPLAASADIVAGYRRVRQDPWHRRLYGLLFGRVLVRLLLGVRVRDLNCAFKLMRRDLVQSLGLASDGALINAELLGKAMRRHARVVEVGVDHLPRRAGTPTGGRPDVILRALRELVALRTEIRRVPPR